MEGILITVALLLLTIIIGIVSYMIYNIKMAGMEVNDFWDFIKSVEKLKKLYAFSKIYENLDIQEQIIFIKEAEQVFSAFEKVPTKLWEDEYQKYMKVLNRYQKEKLKHWKITQNDKEVRFNRGSINIRINKIIGLLIILTIFIHMIKNTNIIYTISRIREII
jgi:hypothetical protein